MSDSTKKSKIILVPVTWMISPSMPCISLASDEEGNTDVSFNVFYGKHNNKEERLTRRFFPVFQCSMFAVIDTHDVLNSEAFDLSYTRLGNRHVKNIDEYLRSFEMQWQTNNICPDSGFYEVENSNLTSRFPSLLKHFIIIGHDAYAVVVAQSWSIIKAEPMVYLSQ